MAGHPGKTSLGTLFFLSYPSSSPFALFLSFAVFSVSRLPELFQSPTWEDLSSTPTFRDHRLRPAGITGEKEVSRKKKESLRKTVRDRRVGRKEGKGFHFLDLWARRMHVTLRARCRFHRVISSYFTLSAAASFFGISVAKDAPTYANKRFHSSNVYFLRGN